MEIGKRTVERPHPCMKQTRKDGPPKGVFGIKGRPPAPSSVPAVGRIGISQTPFSSIVPLPFRSSSILSAGRGRFAASERANAPRREHGGVIKQGKTFHLA